MENIKIAYRRIDLLKPYEGNARVHSDTQVKQIAESIREFGFVNPVLIDKDNLVIAGHGRLLAAAFLGMDKVPTIQVGYLSDRQRRALSIADNRIALNSSWDVEKLTAELNELAQADFDLSLTGFDEQELDNLLRSDEAIIPAWNSELLQTEEKKEPEEKSVSVTATAKASASHDDYAVFELVMLKDNKEQFVNLLHNIKQEQQYEKLEDAIVYLIDHYKTHKG